MSCLLLCPTEMERAALAAAVSGQWETGVCGFGLVQAGIGAAERFASMNLPNSLCILAGIAGTFDEKAHPVGCVRAASSLQLHGIGAGEGDAYIPANEMGLPGEIVGPMSLKADQQLDQSACAMLSVTTASASIEQAEQRHAMYPDCALEEMEAYSVALASQRAGIAFCCLRAVSNVAGDRDKVNWQIGAALDALAGVLREVSA